MNMITGYISTKNGSIPQVATILTMRDYLGAIRVRWGFGRDNFRVNPGIYAVGNPTETSDVFVTANYKLSFDHLRKNLDGLNAWILVLDTKGINVWCAAGKGTFGTKELVNRIKETELNQIVSHRRLILPQLGAVGVAAHEVKTETASAVSTSEQLKANAAPQAGNFNQGNFQMTNPRGFTVVYGPVHASDIKKFIENNYKADRQMRTVYFPFWERIKLVPVDFMYRRYYLLFAMLLMFVLSGISASGLSIHQSLHVGIKAALNLFLAYTAGIVLIPAFLPYIPGRPFALKGFMMGVVLFAVLWMTRTTGTLLTEQVSWFLLVTSIASFVAMNFTGSSTYTSLSGVKKEMKVAVPLQISFSFLGLLLFVLSRFVN
jgi:CO dehydrogenase/acetyl-CoA synthase gamma subunit (corrinoid Fe-S protein)